MTAMNLSRPSAEVSHSSFVHSSCEDDVAILGPAHSIWVIEAESSSSWLLVLNRPFCMSCLRLRIIAAFVLLQRVTICFSHESYSQSLHAKAQDQSRVLPSDL